MSSRAAVDVIPRSCARCGAAIETGERHLRHTDRRREPPVRFCECAGCARRAGRADLLGGAAVRA